MQPKELCTLPIAGKNKNSSYSSGNRNWYVEDLWEYAAQYNASELDTSVLWEEYKNIFCWLEDDELITNGKFLDQMERILKADLSYPIILDEEGYIMDGVHRLMKAVFNKNDTIQAVRLKKNPPVSYYS